MQLSIIIVNYNVKYFLEHCLLSVIKACKHIKAEIFVVDNKSTDGSEAYLTPKFKSVHFIWNRTNIGFGKANNSALTEATGEYILFLNPDTIVPENCFIESIHFLKSQNNCGAVGVKMVDGSGTFLPESKRSLPNPLSGLFKLTGLSKLRPTSKLLAGYYAGHLPENENNKVSVLAGAYMMMSKKVLEEVKGFDEDFFMYGEDIDLSYRILKAGFKNYYLGKITIIHFKGESTQKKQLNYHQNFYGAMKVFVRKHYSQQLFKQSVLLSSINISQKLAVLQSSLSNKSQTDYINSSVSALIIGNIRNQEKVKKILEASSILSIPSITTSEKLAEKEIIDFCQIEKNKMVILCEDEYISYQRIIETIQVTESKCDFLFFSRGAESIIGSSDKNVKGIFLS